MATLNNRLLNRVIDHQVGVVQYANGLVRRVMALLNRSDSDLANALRAALETMDGQSFAVQRLESVLLAVRQLNATAYERAMQGLETSLRTFSTLELGFQGQLLDVPIPGLTIPLVSLPPEQVYAATLARPFQGRLLSEWASSIATNRMTRIRDTVRMGYVQGQTVPQIVARVRGTKAKGYSDGVIEIDRRSAEAVVRTAVGHTASVARDAMYAANSDLVQAVQWVSTLDDRTSSVCQLHDGLTYTADTHRPIGHSLPWLGGPGQAHWNCRSTAVPVLKSWKDLGLDIAELDPATRSSMDGQVAADTKYSEWFASQSSARQDQIVGPTRGKLFRGGGISFSSFANDKGRWLSLEELRANDAAAFAKAGM